MIQEYWEVILRNEEVRQNLSKIRQEVKDRHKLKLFLNILKGQENKLIDLLQAEDAKCRKNAALLMGETGKQEFLPLIWEAYQKEEQRFVKSSYLSAIGNFDYRQYLETLKNI